MVDFLEDVRGLKCAHDKFFKIVFSDAKDTKSISSLINWYQKTKILLTF
ncbi:hypothetical protein [Thermodesulfobium narugense]|nr:hypothetical protein [Thermodesulfobium narugense]